MPHAAISLRSVAWLTLLTLGQMGLQFAFQFLLAKWFGTAADMDAFVAASALPMSVSGLLAGAFGAAFVPVYIDVQRQSGETAARSMAVQITCWLFLSTVVMWQAARLFAEPIMRGLHPGFDDEQVAKSAELFRALSSLMVWSSLGGLARAWNHCLGRFAITGVAAVLGNGVALTLACQRVGDGGIESVAQAVSVGAIVSFAMQMPWIQIFTRGWPVTDESQSAVRRCVLLMLPMLIGLASTQFDPLVDQYFASNLLTGNLSHLGFASRLASAILTLSTGSLAVVAFPAIARHVANQDMDKLRLEIAAALRFLMLLLVPVVTALLVFGSPLVRDLLQRGRFDAADTRVVAGLLMMLCGLIVGGSLGEIATKVFFSWQNTRTPMLIGLCGYALGLFLKWHWHREHGVRGLAAATSIYYLINAAALLTWIAVRLGLGIFRGVADTLLRVTIGSCAAVAVAVPILKSSLPLPSLLGGAAGAVALLIALLVLKEEVAWRAWRMFVPSRILRDVPPAEPLP